MQTEQHQRQFKLPSSQLYYLKGLTHCEGQSLMKMQTNHIMMLFFYVGGLHILHKQQMLNDNDLKQNIIEHILSLQFKNGQFTSSTLYRQISSTKYQQGHIVFTYSALNCLKILGALQKVDKKTILSSISSLQRQDGSFSSFRNSTESDLRFVYSALSICNLLGSFESINLPKAKQYIDSCFNFDGGYGLRPKDQSHCGAVYCAIAAYQHLNIEIPQTKKLKTIRFLVKRQTLYDQQSTLIGTQGRVGKTPDSCYSFWVGASLQMLTKRNLLNCQIQNFLMRCYRNEQKSFGKYVESKYGDPVHTFHSITGLKIIHNQVGDLSLSKLLRQNFEAKKQENQ